MKMVVFLVLFLLLFSVVFSQNIEEITLEYQGEIEVWLAQNNIRGETRTQRFDGIDLYLKPYINTKYPKDKVYGKGGSVIDCFAVGKFLTRHERERIYTKAYNAIPAEAKRSFEPFKSFENFRNSLIFNPNILFGSGANSGLNKDFAEEAPYLIFYFGDDDKRFPDVVFDVQSGQVDSGTGKKMLLFPYGYYYVLFKVKTLNGLELVGYYGVN